MPLPTARRRVVLLVASALLAAVACRVEPVTADGGPEGDAPGDGTQPPASQTPVALTGDQAADRAQLARLEEEAKRLARTDGCRTAGDCAAAPVGAKACGGPRYYLPYCRLSTDSAALYRKLGEIERFERAFNERYDVASTCEFVVPPDLQVVAGACRAATR